MGRVGIYDRAILTDNGTFVAINLGYYCVSEHEGDIERYAQTFSMCQEWHKPKNYKGSVWNSRLTDYEQKFLIPSYTPCLLGQFTLKEDTSRPFNLLKGGEYYALAIGTLMNETDWTRILSKKFKCEDDLLDTYTYNNETFCSYHVQSDLKMMRDVPFAAAWGTGAQGIYLYVRATKTGERWVRSIKHCIERGNMMIAPPSLTVIPNTHGGGLELLNCEKLSKIMAGDFREISTGVWWTV